MVDKNIPSNPPAADYSDSFYNQGTTRSSSVDHSHDDEETEFVYDDPDNPADPRNPNGFSITGTLNRLKTELEEAQKNGSNTSDGATDPNDDTSADLEQLVQALNDSIANAYSLLFADSSSSYGSMAQYGRAIVDLLGSFKKALHAYGLNEANSWSMSQYVYNALFELVNQQLSNELALRNWYMQQDYNLPSSQILRLMEAGINPAFYYGCASKSNADSISSLQADAPQSNGLADPSNMSDTKRRLLQAFGVASGAAGVVGSIVQGGFGGVTSGIKNLADSTATIGNYELNKNLNPHQISLLEANAANSWAQKFLADTDTAYKPEIYKAQQYELMARGKNYSENIRMLQKDLDNKLAIAKMQDKTNRFGIRKNYEGTVVSAGLGAAATKYAAKLSSDANRFGASISLANAILPHIYTHQRQENLYDVETGEKVELSAKERLNLKLGILKGGVEAFEGKEMMHKGRKVVGMYLDTDVLDVMRLNGACDYFNNFLETNHVLGKKAIDPANQCSNVSDYLQMYNYVMPYVNKAAAGAITDHLMNAASDENQSKGFMTPVPLYDSYKAQHGTSFKPFKY